MARCFPIFGDECDRGLFDPDELIDLFLNCTADGIAIVDLENRFIRVNHMYTEIFGYTEEDVIGRSFKEFPNPDYVMEIVSEVKMGRVFQNMVTQRSHKDGHKLDIAVSYSPLRNSKGQIIAIIALFRDITDIISMEKELKKTRELYKLITENTTDLIKVFTKDTTIVYASPSYEKVVGIPPEEIVGRKIMEFISPDEIEAHSRAFQKLLATGEPQLVQKKWITVDQEVLYAEYNISPIYNEQGEMDSFVIVGRNITERIKNDAAMRNLDRLSIIGQLAAGVAHEIRNPLTSLKGFSKLLKSAVNTEKQDEYLSIITGELDRIDMIVNEFMSLAKPQAIKFERGNLVSILKSTVNVLSPQALLDNVQLHLGYQQEDDVDLLCSPNQLKQVFVNILKNAIESMPNGGNIDIQIRKLENNRVEITFVDEGMGIDDELLRYLGTPFYTTKDKGIGLGLTVSNKIIQEHNGIMKIDSRQGKGATVKIDLEHI